MSSPTYAMMGLPFLEDQEEALSLDVVAVTSAHLEDSLQYARVRDETEIVDEVSESREDANGRTNDDDDDDGKTLIGDDEASDKNEIKADMDIIQLTDDAPEAQSEANTSGLQMNLDNQIPVYADEFEDWLHTGLAEALDTPCVELDLYGLANEQGEAQLDPNIAGEASLFVEDFENWDGLEGRLIGDLANPISGAELEHVDTEHSGSKLNGHIPLLTNDLEDCNTSVNTSIVRAILQDHPELDPLWANAFQDLLDNPLMGDGAEEQNLFSTTDGLPPLTSFNAHLGDYAYLTKTVASRNINDFCLLQVIGSADRGCFFWTKAGRHGSRGVETARGDGTLERAILEFEMHYMQMTGQFWGMEPIENVDNETWKHFRLKENETAFPDRTKACLFDAENYPGQPTMVWHIGQEKNSLKASRLPPPVLHLVVKMLRPEHQIYPKNKMFVFSRLIKDLDNTLITEAIATLGRLGGLLISEDGFALAKRYPALWIQQVYQASDEYLSIIPHHTENHTRGPSICNELVLDVEVQMLEWCLRRPIKAAIYGAAYEDGLRLPLLERHLRRLQLRNLKYVLPQSVDFVSVKEYMALAGDSDYYTLTGVFRCERVGEQQAYETFLANEMNNLSSSHELLLWYSVPVGDLREVLKTGIKLQSYPRDNPRRRIESGICFRDSIKGWQIRPQDEQDFVMLLCQVQFGSRVMQIVEPQREDFLRAPTRDIWSALIIGNNRPIWRRCAARFNNLLGATNMPVRFENDRIGPREWNEYVVFNPAQIRIRHIVRLGRKISL